MGKIGENSVVKSPLKAMFSNVMHQRLKKCRVHSVSNDIFVRPFGHRLGKRPS